MERVIIYNRRYLTDRLSNSIVSLHDDNNNVLATYEIGTVGNTQDVSNLEFEIDIEDFTVSSFGEEICLGSSRDKELAKSAMYSCDESMSLLLGSTTSVGTLRDIASLINGKGPEYMPGEVSMLRQ